VVLALAPHYYTDADIFRQEKEKIFFRTWQFAGHLSQVANPGDYFTFRICDQNLFVIRSIDGELRAFYNVCKHRAHELLTDRGNTRRIVCPYHAWTYETNGRLQRARNSENVPGFDPSTICLSDVRLEVFCSYIFVNVDPDARPMRELFPGIEAEIREFVPKIDDLKLAHAYSAEEKANWKIAVENYNECYHCRVVHKAFSSGVVDAESFNVVPDGYCLRHTARAAKTSAYGYDQQQGDHVQDYKSWYLWPTFSIQVYPGSVVNTYRWWTDDVAGSVIHREWWLPNGEVTEEQMKVIELDRTQTFAEDLSIISSVQRGLASRGYRSGPLIIDPAGGVNSELSVAALHKLVIEALEQE
jgi:carnitine monooxygenase subunit